MSVTVRRPPDALGELELELAPAVHRRRVRPKDLGWTIALAGLLVVTAALMLYLTRGLTFTLDEWWVVTERRGPGAPSLLTPHNEHLTLLPLLVFLGTLSLAGLDAYWLMMLTLVALQLTLGVLLFVIARRRLGAGVGVGVAALALLSGMAYENFLIAGQAAQMFSIVAGVAAFALLDRPVTRRRTWLLGALIAVALASSGLGIAILAGVTAELLLSAEGRRSLPAVLVPFALYLAWYAAYGVSRASPDELAAGVLWAGEAAFYAAGALIGERGIQPGRMMFILVLIAVVLGARKLDRPGRVRLLALAVVLLTFYGLTGLSRHDLALPSSSRYLTLGLVFMLLMLVECARGLRRGPWMAWAVLLVAWLAFAKAEGHANSLREGRTLLLERSMRARGALGAVELLGRANVRPGFEIAPRFAPLMTAQGWFEARASLSGAPAYGPQEIARARADVRAAADDTLVRGGGLALTPPRARVTSCERPWAGAAGPVPPGGVRVQAGTTRLTLRARRFGEEWVAVGVVALGPGQAAELHPLPDAASGHPYLLQAQGARQICRLSG